MAVILHPTIEKISKFKVPLAKGEAELLHELRTLFKSSAFTHRFMEIYVKPNLFFGRPDFVIIEKKSSIWIINVEGREKTLHKIDKKGKKASLTSFSSPENTYQTIFKEVKNLRKEIMIEGDPDLENLAKNFGEQKTEVTKYNLIARSAICFSAYTKQDIEDFKNELTINPNYPQFDYSYFFNLDDPQTVANFFERTYVKAYQLTDQQHRNVHVALNLGEAIMNEPLPSFKSEQYRQACQSIVGWRKVRGPAGSGKTTVLAKRVADCAERLKQGQEILIVTFNKTICHYIQEKVRAEAGKDLNELGVTIANFHSLYNWSKVTGSWRIVGKSNNYRYDAVFIDEGQDFKRYWYDRLITDYLKNSEKQKNEYVIFADEVQNIYSREQKEEIESGLNINRADTPVPGNWRTLKGNFRVYNSHINQVADRFSELVLEKNVEKIDDINRIDQITLEYGMDEKKVLYTKIQGIREIGAAIREYVNELVSSQNANINDIVILSGAVKSLRYLEKNLRTERVTNNLFRKTVATFVPQEKVDINPESANEDDYYKRNFFRNRGGIKFSTIHSFKGWESSHVILVLHDPDVSETKNLSYNEATYVGITRAKDDLFIIDTKGKYEKLFKEMTDDVKIE